MTKEDLEREARINLKRRFGEFFPQLTISYVMGAEPREKRIEELQAQIEKMKRCEICKHYPEGSCEYQYYSQQVCKENGMKLFELKEIKEK